MQIKKDESPKNINKDKSCQKINENLLINFEGINKNKQ